MTTDGAQTVTGERTFPCTRCGAKLRFRPGTDTLTCEHCGTVNDIPKSDEVVQEEDYLSALAEMHDQHEKMDALVLKCGSCGAQTVLPPNVTSKACAFCGTPVVATAMSAKLLKPRSLLPFLIDRKKAMEEYERWLGGLWFAPSDLKSSAFLDAAVSGMYLPFWTYDGRATTRYTGQRGEHYWDTETYTTTENGQLVTRTRQVQRTRWYPASGEVQDEFDDILVPATTSLPAPKLTKLEPWDLKDVVPYNDAYLSGFVSQSYEVELDAGFEVAKQIAEPTIESTVRSDIGGDEQIINAMQSRWDRVTFKHILLPVWISAYRYRGRVFQILVNARTGELVGDRPYSAWKITFLVLFILLVIGVVALVAVALNHR